MGITTVSWVLTSYNLVLALVAVPAALLARRRPRAAFVGGRRGLRGGVAGLRARAVVRAARRRALRPGGRRQRSLVVSALALLCRDDGERRPRGARLGDSRASSALRSGRPRAASYGGARLGGDLLRPGAARPRAARGASHGLVDAHRSPAPAGRPHLGANPRCSSFPAVSWLRSSCSCSCSSPAGACRPATAGDRRHGACRSPPSSRARACRRAGRRSACARPAAIVLVAGGLTGLRCYRARAGAGRSRPRSSWGRESVSRSPP